MESLGQALSRLLPTSHLQILSAHAPAYAALFQTYPTLTSVPLENIARVCCWQCGGAGVLGAGEEGDPTCITCRGTGLVCPYCRGRRRLVYPGQPGHRKDEPCPNCPTAAEANASIVGYLQGSMK